MVRTSRPADDDRDDRGRGHPVPGSLPIRAVELAMRNPVTTGGLVVSVLMVGVTVANAIVNQPVRHPHPLFETRAVMHGEGRPTPPAVPAPASVPTATATTPTATATTPVATQAPTGSTAAPPATAGLPRVPPRPKPVSALEEEGIRELQTVLAERGFYSGSVDGVVGPATAEAIKACERRLGTTPTGEASELLLAALRAAPTLVAQAAPVPAPAASRQAAAPVRPMPAAVAKSPAEKIPPAAPAAPPTPSMRVAAATADAVAYPATREEMDYAEVDVPVFTGSIRRAAREPLAPGGDEKLQKLQRALISAGYGPLRADGRWEEHSIAAVRRYEADRGWPVTGRPSEKLVWDLMPKAAQVRR